ncbi:MULTISPECIES: hypothetical protein [Methylobacterium]|uniref:Uncharacterized protein n=1 Tax=Methylobacterium longum TaxID=767694 RepID=A0ABT8AK28_9HYPH|nr:MULTISPECIES: hypothetical protein [Methylobacterium]MCJ2099808.1 hypothetical protein [Methylobacterium sp. E-046]MDN3570057.1 hypothetical protein [Methylobacterium longum]
MTVEITLGDIATCVDGPPDVSASKMPGPARVATLNKLVRQPLCEARRSSSTLDLQGR